MQKDQNISSGDVWQMIEFLTHLLVGWRVWTFFTAATRSKNKQFSSHRYEHVNLIYRVCQVW